MRQISVKAISKHPHSHCELWLCGVFTVRFFLTPSHHFSFWGQNGREGGPVIPCTSVLPQKCCSLIQSGFITTVIRVPIKLRPCPDAALSGERQEERQERK